MERNMLRRFEARLNSRLHAYLKGEHYDDLRVAVESLGVIQVCVDFGKSCVARAKIKERVWGWFVREGFGFEGFVERQTDMTLGVSCSEREVKNVLRIGID